MVRFVQLLLAFLVALAPVSVARADLVDDAVAFVGATVEALSDARQSGAGEPQVLAVLDARFDLSSMALSALQSEIRTQASSAELKAYFAAYRTYLARVFVADTNGVRDGELDILGTRQHDAAVILIGTHVRSANRPRRLVEWYVRTAPPLRVVNASVDGLLVTSQQKRDFQKAIDQGGLAALTRALETDFIAGAGHE